MTSMSTATQTRAVVDQSTGEAMALVPLDGADRFSMQQYLEGITSDDALAAQKSLASAYDRAVDALVGPNDVQEEGKRKFKKKSAWRKLQRHFRISTEVVSSDFREVSIVGSLHAPDRLITVVLVRVRAIAPWGQSAEAIGGCGMDEETPDTEGTYEDSGKKYTRKGKSLSLADMAATAETRATNRAVSNLIASGEVSAEEIGRGRGAYGNTSASRPPRGDSGERRDRQQATVFDPDAVFPRGKHKGSTFREILVKDKQYLEWFHKDCTEKIQAQDQYARPQAWVDALFAFMQGSAAPAAAPAAAPSASRATREDESPAELIDDDDDLPF
jgi:hypothetical protein